MTTRRTVLKGIGAIGLTSAVGVHEHTAAAPVAAESREITEDSPVSMPDNMFIAAIMVASGVEPGTDDMAAIWTLMDRGYLPEGFEHARERCRTMLRIRSWNAWRERRDQPTRLDPRRRRTRHKRPQRMHNEHTAWEVIYGPCRCVHWWPLRCPAPTRHPIARHGATRQHTTR
jgi:hypothetical protein